MDAGRATRWSGSPGPEPAEGASGQQPVDESIGEVLCRRAPGLSHPDGRGHCARSVAEEADGCCDTEHLEKLRAAKAVAAAAEAFSDRRRTSGLAA